MRAALRVAVRQGMVLAPYGAKSSARCTSNAKGQRSGARDFPPGAHACGKPLGHIFCGDFGVKALFLSASRNGARSASERVRVDTAAGDSWSWRCEDENFATRFSSLQRHKKKPAVMSHMTGGPWNLRSDLRSTLQIKPAERPQPALVIRMACWQPGRSTRFLRRLWFQQPLRCKANADCAARASPPDWLAMEFGATGLAFS